MNFSAREDIEAPIEFVFGRVSDFEALERRALRRGAEVERTDKLSEPGPGMGWRMAFTLRGKRRKMKVEMVSYDLNRPGFTGDCLVRLKRLYRMRSCLHSMPPLPQLV